MYLPPPLTEPAVVAQKILSFEENHDVIFWIAKISVLLYFDYSFTIHGAIMCNA